MLMTTLDEEALAALRGALPEDPDEWPAFDGHVTVPALAVVAVVNMHRHLEDYTERELRWLLACYVADWEQEQTDPSADWQFGYKATWLPLQGSQVVQTMHAKGIAP